MSVKPIPEGYTTVTPWIISRDTAMVIDYIRKGVRRRGTGPGDRRPRDDRARGGPRAAAASLKVGDRHPRGKMPVWSLTITASAGYCQCAVPGTGESTWRRRRAARPATAHRRRRRGRPGRSGLEGLP